MYNYYNYYCPCLAIIKEAGAGKSKIAIHSY